MNSPDFFDALFSEFDRLTLDGIRQARAEAKPDGSIITEVDRAVSALVLERLKQTFPKDGIVCEEEPEAWQAESPRLWMVDPLDGTASFSRGFPLWGLGMGLLEGDQPVAGYLRFPMVGESYRFHEGKGLLNGQPLPPPPATLLPDNTQLMVGSKLHHQLPLHRLKEYKLRDFGSTLYHIMAVAAGRAEAVITPTCSLWDIAAGLAFTRAQGLIEQYIDGSPFSLKQILANPDRRWRIAQPLVIGPPERVSRVVSLLQI
ncbi:MAG: inositol monophosphatase [Deltaproteobacteria bacterium]|nr:inositol monophosphatase [Deltaproteobacteria bacterium]